MSVIIKGMDKPCTCCECPFRSKYEEISIDVGVYQKVSFCTFAPDDVEDPYRDIAWQTKNIEEWCPIQEVSTDNISVDGGKQEEDSNMKRLTEWDEKEQKFDRVSIKTTNQQLINKLAVYEGLEESGKLQIFPCTVGDTVYVDSRTIPTMTMDFETVADVPLYFTARVVSFRQNSKGKFIKLSVRAKWLHEWIDSETGPDSAYYEVEKYFTYSLSAVGKTIFLTSDEAEEKLKRMEVQNGKTE